jgi:type II secretory pathway predicted ATPase ExeA
MYEAFYGFKEKPFSMLPDPGFLFLSKKHQAALTLLEYGLLNHVGFCVVSGEPGAGKTTILRALLDRISDDITVGLITNTHQSFGGLLDWVLSAFDLHEPNLTHVEMHQRLMDFLIEEYAKKRSVLLIVDEAQNMKADTLEELRMLSNVNSEKDQLLQVVLAGQPALKDTLRQPELMQFAQRIAVDYHLASLNLEETCGYIQHRLKTAGAERDVFTPAACARIHQYSGGTPRLINLLCETVLVYGFADQCEMIDVDLVDEMVQERMKDSVVPLVNRDIVNRQAADDETEGSDAEGGGDDVTRLEKNFPWIGRPGNQKAEVVPAEVDDTELDDHAATGQAAAESIEPDQSESDKNEPAKGSVQDLTTDQFSTGNADQGSTAERKQSIQPVDLSIEQAIDNTATAQVLEKKTAQTKASSLAKSSGQAKTFTQAHEDIYSGKVADDAGTDNSITTKIIIIAAILGLALIAAAITFGFDGRDDGVDPAQETLQQLGDELEQQRQQGIIEREKEEARLKQLQLEADKLKAERDAAIAKAEAEKQAKLEAQRLADEKAAQAVKAAEEQRKLDEQRRIAAAKERERKARLAEERAKAEAEKVRLEAARLAEEKEALRLKQLEEERARLEAERLAAIQAAEEAAEQAAKEAAEAAARKEAELLALEEAEKAKKKPAECEGPTARFRAGCR